ncbi:VENN motif pre-toxin domain-containing protein [uncultured Herbaspirillum sp.]|uniref:VENN motif pre-toxin domain-containing protein n=1 Tax=uncultured Herbaspirillum sp. TaxID=160236 RepID=UPI00258F9DEB|nr:VENN motif pre-toxin domain-containing protein [uncultured Herbaspirillum sp.]
MNLIEGNFITQFLVCYPGWFPAPAGNPYVMVLMGGIAPLGATLGGLTGGSTQDALVGATVAGNAAANNFLKHQQFNEFKSRYAQCTTKECRDNVLTDMKTLSDAQDVLLTKCTTVAACKELTRDIVYPTKQNGFLGFFITKTTDTYNFCAAGDGACMDTLKYISAHTNGAALTSIAPEFFAAVNWKTATIESGTAELEARFDLSPQTARMLASILSEMGQGVALLGTKVGKDGAGRQKMLSTLSLMERLLLKFLNEAGLNRKFRRSLIKER